MAFYLAVLIIVDSSSHPNVHWMLKWLMLRSHDGSRNIPEELGSLLCNRRIRT
jgi:hypothetical protein